MTHGSTHLHRAAVRRPGFSHGGGSALEAGDRVIGLSFDYGQRHRRELEAATAVASHLGLAEHHRINVDLAAWGGSASPMQPSGSPRRCQNGVIPPPTSRAQHRVHRHRPQPGGGPGASTLVLGVNAVTIPAIPIAGGLSRGLSVLANLASKAGRRGHGTQLWAPLVEWSKTRIVEEALRLSVPIQPPGAATAVGQGLRCLRQLPHPRCRPAGAGRPDLVQQRISMNGPQRLELPWREPIAWPDSWTATTG
ncbi:MAG: hypothetical protein CM15mP116_08550 [Synechococcus sp.]|nr:MAG: hypothetical protein CM15mP116_08550 [Synechococcus sp.]